LVDALIEPNALAVVVIVVAGGRHAVGAAHIDGNVFAHLRPCHHRLDGGVGGDDDAYRPQPYAIAPRREQNAQLVAVPWAAVFPAPAERRRYRFDIARRPAHLAQERGDRVAFLEHDRAFVPGIAAGHLRSGLGQQADVFRHDSGFETGIGIAMPLWRVGR